VYARRTGVRIPFRAPRERRSYDTFVRPQALWLPALPRSVWLSSAGSWASSRVDMGFCVLRSGSRPSRTRSLLSWATCVLAAPGSGSRLGRLDESDRKTRVTGHTRCGCQPCREAGGCVPFARELSVPERRPSFPNAKTAVLGDVYASRARVRIPFRADWGQRSHDTVVRPRAAWEPDLPPSVRLSCVGSWAGSGGDMGFCPLRSGSRPSRTATLLSWATCVLAALGSGWDLGRLRYFDRRTRVSLHGQRGSGFPSPLAPS